MLTGRCYEQESVPYKALDSLVDGLVHHLLGLSDLELERLIPPDVAALARIFPVLARVDLIAAAVESSATVPDLTEFRRRGSRRSAGCSGGWASAGPWCWPSTTCNGATRTRTLLLEELLQSPGTPRLFLLITHRSEDPGTAPCLALWTGSTRSSTAPA